MNYMTLCAKQQRTARVNGNRLHSNLLAKKLKRMTLLAVGEVYKP